MVVVFATARPSPARNMMVVATARRNGDGGPLPPPRNRAEIWRVSMARPSTVQWLSLPLHLELLLFLTSCLPLGLRVTIFALLLPCSHVLAAPLPLIT